MARDGNLSSAVQAAPHKLAEPAEQVPESDSKPRRRHLYTADREWEER